MPIRFSNLLPSNVFSRPSHRDRSAPPAALEHPDAPPPPYDAPVTSASLSVDEALVRLADRKLFPRGEAAPAWLVQRMQCTFLVLSPSRRERFVTALGDMFEKRPSSEWEDLFAALLLRCRADDRQTWRRWLGAMQLLTAVKDPSLAWSKCAATLSANPGREEQLARSAVFFSADGWSVTDSFAVIASAAAAVDAADLPQFLERVRVTTQPMQTLAQKMCIANAISRLSESDWGMFGSVGQALCEGLSSTTDTTPLLDELSAVFAANKRGHGESIGTATLRLCDKALDVGGRVQILRSVNHVTSSSRAEFIALCVHMRQHNLSPNQFAANVQTLADTVADKRLQHCQDLLKGHAARAANLVDPQNTSLYQRIERTRTAIATIQKISKEIDTKEVLADVRECLKAMLPDCATPPELSVWRARAREVDNAWRTLCTPAQGRDLSGPLLKDPAYFIGDAVVHLGTLAAQVWVLVCNYEVPGKSREKTEQARDNLRASYFLALASCIEDDGYRVCNTGVAQRLLQVLQGYVGDICLDYVTPQNLVAELAAEHARDESPGLPAFYARACARASEMYDARSPAYRTFKAHLCEYLKMDYGWDHNQTLCFPQENS